MIKMKKINGLCLAPWLKMFISAILLDLIGAHNSIRSALSIFTVKHFTLIFGCYFYLALMVVKTKIAKI